MRCRDGIFQVSLSRLYLLKVVFLDHSQHFQVLGRIMSRDVRLQTLQSFGSLNSHEKALRERLEVDVVVERRSVIEIDPWLDSLTINHHDDQLLPDETSKLIASAASTPQDYGSLEWRHMVEDTESRKEEASEGENEPAVAAFRSGVILYGYCLLLCVTVVLIACVILRRLIR
jgi:hypothetical protein